LCLTLPSCTPNEQDYEESKATCSMMLGQHVNTFTTSPLWLITALQPTSTLTSWVSVKLKMDLLSCAVPTPDGCRHTHTREGGKQSRCNELNSLHGVSARQLAAFDG